MRTHLTLHHFTDRVLARTRSKCPARERDGFSRMELMAVLAVIAVVAAVLTPTMLGLRERMRLQSCESRLRSIGAALHEYHGTHQSLPVAAVWRGDQLRTTMLNEVKQIDRITYQNWAQLLLPHLGRTDVASLFDPGQPVMSDANLEGRLTHVVEFQCPSDHFNRSSNPHVFQPDENRDPIAELARGNYAINGGTHNHRFHPESAAQPRFDGLRLIVEDEPRRFELIGSGIAGINHAFRLDEFENGQSTLVAAEEIRAGIHELDPRGVWALGQVGGSITWAHGVSSDACGPNNQWDRADDILGCGRLHEVIGSETLSRERMPCVHYVDRNDQATARSLHQGGVNVLMLDGAVRFVNDRVDRALWHVMHARDTPADVLTTRFEPRLVEKAPPADAAAIERSATTLATGTVVANSLEMKFVVIPDGKFTMGLPDHSAGDDTPPECPRHPVIIPRPLLFGQHEVTQKQFEQVMGRNPSFHTTGMIGVENSENFPVDSVSWNDAQDFCIKLSSLPEERAAARTYRLPTEAEWEYACRNGKSERYHWHPHRKPNDESGDNSGILPSLPLRPVGSYPPSEFQLYDMRGNVWEWTNDWFDRAYYSRSPVRDPQGPAEGFVKVVRGGDWTFIGETCRINYPMMPPWKSSRYVGFRVICEQAAPTATVTQSGNGT